MKQTAKILFIDDNVDDFGSILRILKNLLPEIEIYTAKDGATGIDIARIWQPDIIFLDIMMPGMNGFEVCKKLKSESATEHSSVLFLTSAHTDLYGRIKAIDLGAEDFLQKPVNAVELATRIKIMLKLREYTQHLVDLVREQTRKIEEQRIISARSERLASLGTLAAGIAHEINQPLNALKISVDGLLYWGERNMTISNQDLYDTLKLASEQASRIDDIIKHMQALAHSGENLLITPVDVESVVHKAFTLIGRQIASHKIKVIMEFEPEMPLVQANPTQLEQIVINLVINAMNVLDKHVKENKTITISGEVKGDIYLLSVSDNGPGIPEEIIDRIFDPFFTSKVTSDGMGLGLAITQNLSAGFGGSLYAENIKESGAKFTVTIPIAVENEEEDED
ncbi:response regulator [bacterium]|nr:response regulator [bacterium]